MNKRTMAAIGSVTAGAGLAWWLTRRRTGAAEGLRSRAIGLGRRAGAGARQMLSRPEWDGRSRFIAGLAGGALSYYGLRRRGVLGSALATAGAGLLSRGATNRRARSLFGLLPALGIGRR